MEGCDVVQYIHGTSCKIAQITRYIYAYDYLQILIVAQYVPYYRFKIIADVPTALRHISLL